MSVPHPSTAEEVAASPVRALFAGHIAEDLLFPYPEIAPEERETVSAFLEGALKKLEHNRDAENTAVSDTAYTNLGYGFDCWE